MRQSDTEVATVRLGFVIGSAVEPAIARTLGHPLPPDSESLVLFDLANDDLWATGDGRHHPMRIEVDGWAAPGGSPCGPLVDQAVEVVARVDDDWTLRVEGAIDGEGVLRWQRYVFEPARSDVSDLSQRHLRKLGYGAVLDAASRWLRHELSTNVLGDHWQDRPKNPGRAGRSDYDYLPIARRYAAACAEDPRRVIQRLIAEEADEGRFATAAQLKARIGRARDRGLLTPAPAGRAGGELTDKALAMIEHMEGAGHGEH